MVKQQQYLLNTEILKSIVPFFFLFSFLENFKKKKKQIGK